MPIKTEKDLPANWKASWLKALSAMQLKNYAYVIQLLQPLVKAEPEFLPGRQLLRKAEVALNAGKKSLFGGISTSSLALLKIAPQVKKEPREAMEALEKVLESEPYNVQANRYLYEAAMALGMNETATFALETIVEGNPKDTKSLHELAQHFMAIDEAEKAVETYNKILEIAPNDLAAVKGSKDAAARVTLKKGGWEEEKTTYRELIKDKEQAVALEQKSRVVRTEDAIDQLLAELHKQMEEQPQSVDTARRIGELYEQKGDLSSAIQWLQYAFQLGGGTDFALERKASDLRIRQFDEAIKQWENYLASSPPAEELENAKKQLEDLRQQRNELRIEAARKRVEQNPTDLQFRFELGEILLELGKPQEAIPELQKARQNPNLRIRSLLLLGKCYEQRNMLDLAAKTLSDAANELVAMDSVKKETLYTLGLIYEKMDQRDKYLDCMKQIYEVDYGYRDVAPRVEQAYSQTPSAPPKG
ncbi:MAG: tetratricopeptide repeat protein [Chthoniobacterales bacterium]|nr:tetratricopeptide repeat protein [Chthoniobacterales bacterium]MCX7712864.1 tetratricopeptide repeat protein [Chthoniobacterales bacterium]